MNAFEITFCVLSNCLLLAVVLTFLKTFEPHRKGIFGRFIFFFGRYALPAGGVLAALYWFAYGSHPHE